MLLPMLMSIAPALWMSQRNQFVQQKRTHGHAAMCSDAQSKCGKRAIDGRFRRTLRETEASVRRTLAETQRTLGETDAQ